MKGAELMAIKKKILVPIDGSKNSKRALLEARRYGDYLDVEITLLTVLKPVAPHYYSYLELSKPDNRARLVEAAEALMKDSVELLGYPEDKVTTKIRRGDPANEILEEANEGGYQLIIMGSRGLGIFSRSFLGSVSYKVLSHTNINVLIVK